MTVIYRTPLLALRWMRERFEDYRLDIRKHKTVKVLVDFLQLHIRAMTSTRA